MANANPTRHEWLRGRANLSALDSCSRHWRRSRTGPWVRGPPSCIPMPATPSARPRGVKRDRRHPRPHFHPPAAGEAGGVLEPPELSGR
jgi:hypothetical protein